MNQIKDDEETPQVPQVVGFGVVVEENPLITLPLTRNHGPLCIVS